MMHRPIFNVPAGEREPARTMADAQAAAVAFVRRTGQAAFVLAFSCGLPGREGYGFLVSNLAVHQTEAGGSFEKLAEIARTPDGLCVTYTPAGNARRVRAATTLLPFLSATSELV